MGTQGASPKAYLASREAGSTSSALTRLGASQHCVIKVVLLRYNLLHQSTYIHEQGIAAANSTLDLQATGEVWPSCSPRRGKRLRRLVASMPPFGRPLGVSAKQEEED